MCDKCSDKDLQRVANTRASYADAVKNGSADASDLGWEPGEWPESFVVDTLKFTKTETHGGVYVVYSDTVGHTVTVFND